MSRRAEQQTRYWLTEKGWAAALCVSANTSTTPSTPTEPTHQETHRD